MGKREVSGAGDRRIPSEEYLAPDAGGRYGGVGAADGEETVGVEHYARENRGCAREAVEATPHSMLSASTRPLVLGMSTSM